MFRKHLAGIMAVTLMTTAAPAVAAPGVSVPEGAAASIAVSDLASLVTRADPYVKVVRGRWVLAGTDNGALHPDDRRAARALIRQANAFLDDAGLQAKAYEPLVIPEGGRSGVEVHWWGFALFMDRELTDAVALALQMAAGASASANQLCRVIPQLAPLGLAYGIAGALAGMAAAVIRPYNHGYGVAIDFALGFIPFSISSQTPQP